MAPRHQHRHVRLLLGRPQQLPRHIQQGSPRHHRRHRHLLCPPLHRPLRITPTRTQGPQQRPHHPQCRRGHAHLSGRLHHLRRHPPSRRLLPLRPPHRFRQRPSLSRLPQHVHPGSPSRPARHRQQQHPHRLGLRLWHRLPVRRHRLRALRLHRHLLDCSHRERPLRPPLLPCLPPVLRKSKKNHIAPTTKHPYKNIAPSKTTSINKSPLVLDTSDLTGRKHTKPPQTPASLHWEGVASCPPISNPQASLHWEGTPSCNIEPLPLLILFYPLNILLRLVEYKRLCEIL